MGSVSVECGTSIVEDVLLSTIDNQQSTIDFQISSSFLSFPSLLLLIQ